MSAIIQKLFIDPESIIGCDVKEGQSCWEDPDYFYGLFQVCVLCGVYGYIIMNASNILADGSELLLLVPSLAGIVGSVVLPTLGAVPDAMIMLFSGLGPIEEAQEQISVGIGALAGSTIMLLTIPWSLATYAGAVPIENGECNYKKRSAHVPLTKLCSYGVQPDKTIYSNAFVMLITCISYLIIQFPAMSESTSHSSNKESIIEPKQHTFALAGLISCTSLFVGYLLLMVAQADSAEAKDKEDRIITKCLFNEHLPVTLSGVVGPLLQHQMDAMSPSRKSLGDSLISEDRKRLGHILNPFFHKYDLDNDGQIDLVELRLLLGDLGEKVSGEEAAQWMDKMDPDGNGHISQDEFVEAMIAFVQEVSSRSMRGGGGEQEEEDEDEDEEDDMPEEIEHLSPEEQQKWILKKSFGMMGYGTFLILLFSDPLVDVLSALGTRVGIPAFYIAFVLAPLASNGSEFIASYQYAKKKTKKTITISLSALEGAACMNNTFCLAVFMALIYFRGLVWEFTAETLVILVIQLAIAGIAVQRVQTLSMALIAILLMPLSLIFVAVLESYGYD